MKKAWDLAGSDWLDPQARLDEARRIWNADEYKATWSAFHVAFFAVQSMAGGSEGQPVAVAPASPPDSILAVLGDRSRAARATHAVWNVVAGVAVSVHGEVDDPFLEGQLKSVSRDYKGSGVYLYAWRAASALSQIKSHDGAADDQIRAIEEELSQLGRI